MCTDPERLTVALDDLGSRVGVRIRCEADMNRAVVIVEAQNKPAREVFQKILDGIGAGSIIQGGTIYVGMGVASPAEKEKLQKQYVQTLKYTFENLCKRVETDKPLDDKELQNCAAFALASFNRDPQFGGIQVHPSVYQIAGKTPIQRFCARLLQVVGPERFAEAPDTGVSYVTMKELPDDVQQKVLQVLETLRTEQDTWATAFAAVRKKALAVGATWLPIQITSDAEPIEKVQLTGFRAIVRPDTHSVVIEALSGNEAMAEGQEYLPARNSRYINQSGQSFNASAADGFTVPYSDQIARLTDMIAYGDGKPKPIDHDVLKLLASPWKNDPLSFCRSQPAGLVAQKLGLNLVAYLGDQVLYNTLYLNAGLKEAKGSEVLNYLRYGGYTSGLWKKDDWLLVPCYDPESYLRHQMDRSYLDKFLSRVYQPGCMSLDEYCDHRKGIGRESFGMANMLAQLIQPGFDSLNPFGGVADLWMELSPAQKGQMSNGGIAISSLPNKLFGYVNNLAQAYGGYRYPGEPEGLYTDPPTKQEVKKARLAIATKTTIGLLTRYNDNNEETYQRWANYAFTDLANWANVRTDINSVINSIPSQRARICHATTIGFVINVPRKQGAQVLATQYDADVSIPATPKNDLRDAIARILQGF